MFTNLDLFSGIGGFALATHWAGGQTVAFAETADYPSKILSQHWPDVPNLGDVRKLCRRIADNLQPGQDYDPDFLECSLCGNGIDFGDCECIGTDQFLDTYGPVDVITAGVPCQPTSLVGKRGGSSDERWLWPDTIRIIGELRPRFAVLEQPRAILTLDGGERFREIVGALSEFGYDLLWEPLSASALGAGHRRERLWIIAADSDCPRLERHTGDGEVGGYPSAHGHFAASDLRTRELASPQWYRQSGLEPVVNGLPGGLVKDQLTAIGNSLVPQVAYVWLSQIARALAQTTGHTS